MKPKQLLMALALTAAMSTAAIAEEHKAPPPAPGQEKNMSAENFQERKAKMLKHMSERMAEMQKKQACVQAANDPEALRGCFPNRGGKWGKGEGHGENPGEGKHEGHGPGMMEGPDGPPPSEEHHPK